MTAAGAILEQEIEEGGPVSFARFMEVALYHPEHGYYTRRGHDPFGTGGDFFTAEQFQPVFGRVIASVVRETGQRRILELGAGRGEMAGALAAEFEYAAFEVTAGTLPGAFEGLVFCNEFFDALPVRVFSGGTELRVGMADGRFVFVPDLTPDRERHDEMASWLRRIGALLTSGFLLAIDYGFHEAERARFPHGSLMSYRRHQADPRILLDPGERDITSHVPFTEMIRGAAEAGLRLVREESLAALILRAGAADEFASILAAHGDRETLRLRLQLKTLLAGMGESFRALLFAKA